MRVPAILAPMLREPAVCVGLFGAAAILVSANLLGVSLWPCVFHETTGMPCPGCGLTRGMSSLLRGDIAKSLAWNAFTPAFALAAAVMLLANVLPSSARIRFVAWVDGVERRTGITWIFAALFVIYGVWRMIAHPHWP